MFCEKNQHNQYQPEEIQHFQLTTIQKKVKNWILQEPKNSFIQKIFTQIKNSFSGSQDYRNSLLAKRVCKHFNHDLSINDQYQIRREPSEQLSAQINILQILLFGTDFFTSKKIKRKLEECKLKEFVTIKHLDKSHHLLIFKQLYHVQKFIQFYCSQLAKQIFNPTESINYSKVNKNWFKLWNYEYNKIQRQVDGRFVLESQCLQQLSTEHSLYEHAKKNILRQYIYLLDFNQQHQNFENENENLRRNLTSIFERYPRDVSRTRQKKSKLPSFNQSTVSALNLRNKYVQEKRESSKKNVSSSVPFNKSMAVESKKNFNFQIKQFDNSIISQFSNKSEGLGQFLRNSQGNKNSCILYQSRIRLNENLDDMSELEDYSNMQEENIPKVIQNESYSNLSLKNDSKIIGKKNQEVNVSNLLDQMDSINILSDLNLQDKQENDQKKLYEIPSQHEKIQSNVDKKEKKFNYSQYLRKNQKSQILDLTEQ